MNKPNYSMSVFRPFPPIRFAPFLVPWERRLQTLGVLYYFTLWVHTQCLMFLLTTYMYLWPLIAVYFIHIYYSDIHEKGGRKSNWFGHLPLWKWFASYFPGKLVAESRLDSSQNYIFAVHPHGIHATSALACFGTEGLGFSQIFPGIKTMILTININFIFPIYREIILALGGVGASKQSIANIFAKGPGNSVAIIVGGAEESLLAFPDSSDLILKNRYGFISVAIKHGANLVPTYCFGENKLFDLYKPRPGSFIYNFQIKLKKITGFTIPLFIGRNIFTYNYGFLPKRHPITVVIGSPIILEKDDNPSKEKVQTIHKQYMEELKNLYERNKDKYCVGDAPPIRFV